MKESMAKVDVHSLFSDVEIEVAQILLDLAKSELPSRLRPPPFTVVWGARKRLVCRGTREKSSTTSISPPNLVTPSIAPSQIPSASSSSPSPSPQQRTSPPNETDTKTSQQVKVEATSPHTPLSFLSSSECDDKSPNHSQSHRKNFKKRSREGLMVAINQLTDCREMLTKEVDTVRSYYNKLLAFNAELNAKKQQVVSTRTCHKREEPQLEMKGSLNLGLNPNVQQYQIAVIPNQNPFLKDPTAVESKTPLQLQLQFQYSYGHGQSQVTPDLFPSSSSGSGLVKINHAGPHGIADLRPLEYARALVADNRERAEAADNSKRAKAAEARRNRKIKLKRKVNNCVSGTRAIKRLVIAR